MSTVVNRSKGLPRAPVLATRNCALDSFAAASYPNDMTDGRRWHDMGGQAAGPVALDEHDYALWEKRVDALMVICSSKGYFTVDGLRRALEDMGAEAFETMTYYERWIASVNQNLIETNLYTLEELSQKMLKVAARGPTYGDAAALPETSDG